MPRPNRPAQASGEEESWIWVVLIALVAFMMLGENNPLTPEPAPFVTDKLAVAIIVDTDPSVMQSYSEGQREVMLSLADDGVRAYVESQGGAFRLVNYKQRPSMDEPWVAAAFDYYKPGSPLPYVVVSNGKSGTHGPLPTTGTVDQTRTLVKKYGK